MPQILTVKGLTKRFKDKDALAGVNLTIEEGRIIGLLGPNASGKTTLLKIIAGLYTPTSGDVSYYNGAAAGAAARGTIGFCPDTLAFPKYMRVSAAFKFFGDIYPDYSQRRADQLIEILDLEGVLYSRIGGLSKGMKERLALALTYSRDTKLYLLDEPLDGIDPVGKTRVIDAIIGMQPEGAATVVSTHQVKDIERVLDSVMFLSKGKIVYTGDCDEIRETDKKTVEQKYLEVFINEGTV